MTRRATFSAGARLGAARVECGDCEAEFDRFADRSEAAYFAQVHNELNHGTSLAGAAVVDRGQDVAAATSCELSDDEGWSL